MIPARAFLTPGRSRVLASTGALLALVATWLLVPRPDSEALPTRPPVAAALVDVSTSAAGPRPGWGLWVRGELARWTAAAEEAGAEVLVVEVARAPALVFGPGPAAAWRERLEGRDGEPYRPGDLAGGRERSRDGGAAPWLGSELAAALALLEPELTSPGRAPGRLLLLGDGTGTGASPLGALERLAAAGTAIEAPAAPEPARSDLSLEALRVPARAAAGTALQVGLELGLHCAAQGPRLRAAVDMELRPVGEVAGARPVRSRRVDLGPVPSGRAGGVWRTALELEPLPEGLYRLELRSLLLDPERPTGSRDWIPDNDRATALLEVGDRPRVAVLSRERGPAADFVSRRAGALDLLLVEPAELPELLPRLDALFTVDVPAGELPLAGVEELLARGGGWFSCPGWNSLLDRLAGPGAGDGGLAGLLPLELDPGSREERDVILLVDGSGSMAGEPFERVREAVRRLALAARASDRVQLRFFTGVLGPVVFESHGATPEERRERLVPLMEARAPGGSTDVLHALETLARERAGRASEREGLCLMLTDGRSAQQRDDPLGVREALAATGCDLRILALGRRPGRAFLSRLLLPGESLVEAGDLSELVRILSEEVNRDLLREDPGASLLVVPPDEHPAGSLAAELLRRPWEAQHRAAEAQDVPAPTLPRAARVRLRPGAALLARSSAGGHPLLALGRAGGGTVVAAACAPWGDLAAPGLGQREAWIVELLLALGRGAGEARVGPTVRFTAGGLRVEGLEDPGVRSLQLAGPRGELLTVPLEPVPAQATASGGFRGLLPPELTGVEPGRPWRFEVRGADPARVLARGLVVAPVPAEHRSATWRLPADLPVARDRPPPSSAPSPWALPVLVLGLLVLFASGLDPRRQGPGMDGRHQPDPSPGP